MKHHPIAFFSLAVFLLASNLRAPIVVIGPLMETIRDAINSNATIMGAIGTLPALTFAACSPFAARLAKQFGLENVILVGITMITLGCLIRSLFGNAWTIMIGTIILCAGIAMGNVLLAAVIKRDHPQRIERLTALQMLSFSILSALAAALAIPLAKTIGWQWALGIWAIMTIPAFLVWLRIRDQQHPQHCHTHTSANPNFNIWHSRLAWQISLYTGLQSMLFYTFVAWLATIIAARGFSETQAGYYNTLFQLIAFPTALLISPIAERYRRMHHLLCASSFLILGGTLGIWYASANLMWFFTAILGIGSCASFTLCLMLFAQRGETPAQSAALSGMAQTIGYAIAALGPVCTGWLLDINGNWQIPIYAILAIAILQIISAWWAGQASRL